VIKRTNGPALPARPRRPIIIVGPGHEVSCQEYAFCAAQLRGDFSILRRSGWAKQFDEPISARRQDAGHLEGAAAYIIALPKSKHDTPKWQVAIRREP
jgi:hypothetical protein